MRLNERGRRSLQWLIGAVGCICLAILVSAVSDYQYASEIPVNTEVSIDFGPGEQLIDAQDVMSILLEAELTPAQVGVLSGVDMREIKNLVEAHPYVASAKVFAGVHGELNIEVSQSEPILRIINRDGVSFYLDDLGQILPLASKFTARTLVATGINLETTAGGIGESARWIYDLARHIRSDEFLRALVEQIEQSDGGAIYLHPKIGSFRIRIEPKGDLKGQTDKIKAYYEERHGDDVWKNYQVMDVRFKGQVVCQK